MFDVDDVVNDVHTGNDSGRCIVNAPPLENVVNDQNTMSPRTLAPVEMASDELLRLMRPTDDTPPRVMLVQSTSVVPFHVPLRFWNTLSTVNVPPVVNDEQRVAFMAENTTGSGDTNVPREENDDATTLPWNGSNRRDPSVLMEIE